MRQYNFATVQGDVLRPPAGGGRRPHVPRGSRVHVSMTATTTAGAEEEEGGNTAEAARAHPKPVGQLGITMRLKRKECKESDADNNENGKNEDTVLPRRDDEGSDSLTRVALMGLIATDSVDGTRLTRRTAAVSDEEDYVLWESTVLPSAQRIGCIQLDLETRTTMTQAGTEAAFFPSPLLYVADVVGNVYAARLPEASVAHLSDGVPRKRLRHDTDRESAFWKSIVSATTCSNGTARGARGWCGLSGLQSSQLVCCREFFFDLRILDVSAGSVVRDYGTMHPPTGMTTCAGFPHNVVVAEGPLATVYDVRCAGVALAVQEDGKNDLPLITSRFTSPLAGVADVCATRNEYEIAMAVGRSLCVHDMRKWNCLAVSTNVLKYEIGTIASFAGGNAVAVAGIDAEVRIVPLHAGAVGNQPNNRRHEETAAMSFRKRIDSAVSCISTWNGGWFGSVDGACASGLSVDHEIFLSY